MIEWENFKIYEFCHPINFIILISLFFGLP